MKKITQKKKQEFEKLKTLVTKKGVESTNWTEVIINDWSQFEKFINTHNPKRWIFRGQCNQKWKLTTTYVRGYQEIQKIYEESGREEISHRDAFEQLIVQQFKSQAHLYLDFEPKSDLEWLSLMQHYGSPTRLIDWTFSPYIAMFFALSQGTGISSIFSLNQDKINKFYRQKTDVKELSDIIFNDRRFKDAFIFAFEPEHKNKRMVKQQGLFVVPSNNFEPIDKIMENDKIIGDSSYGIKLIIPSKHRFDYLKKLKKMNITYDTLFPDIEGFCKSLKLSLLDSSENLKRIL